MDEVMAIAGQYGIPVLEDAAEALGSEFKGRKCGTFGEFACLSFNGNKMITTSGGGGRWYAARKRKPNEQCFMPPRHATRRHTTSIRTLGITTG